VINTKLILLLVLIAVFSSLAADDLPVYLDAGCPGTGIPKSYARGPSSMEIATVNGQGAIPITCEDKISGSDAAVIHNTKKIGNGESYDFVFKFGDDRSHSIKSHKDVRMWIKNRGSAPARFRIAWETATYSTGTYHAMEIPAVNEWKEYVVPLTSLGADSVNGLKFSHPTLQEYMPDTAAAPINILIDSITVTDGTGNGSLAIPSAVHNGRPQAWPGYFLTGSFDNRDLNAATSAAQGGCPYRYQYMMPETKDYYSASGKGYLYDYATESEKIGVKTAIVWYNLGKSGEGYTAVSANLQSATYMKEYVDRYEWVLDQLALAGQSDYMIIIEPDMYGFIMRGEQFHPANVAVNMTRANEVSGKTYTSNMIGWAEYLVERAHEKLPDGVMLGHMPNHWGVNIPGQVGQGRKEAHIMSGLTIGQFIKEFGLVGMGDMVFVEKTDHDAGHKPTGENWFWDSAGYGKYFLWTRAIAWRTGLPIVGWQVSEGNMGNATTTLRDNAAETFLAHPEWWVNGGFIGILFGAGNSCCCNYKTDNDGGWFVDHMKTYNGNPYKLPEITGIRNGESGTRTMLNNGMVSLTINGYTIRVSGIKNTAMVSLFDVSGKRIFTGWMRPEKPLRIDRPLVPGVYFATVNGQTSRVRVTWMN
jgi:hypothetical protein